jgi:O-methyltransferase
MNTTALAADRRVEQMYLALLKKCLTRSLSATMYSTAVPWFRPMRWWFLPFQAFLSARGRTVVRQLPVDSKLRSEGRDWPAEAETMIGMKRLDNLQVCIERILEDGVAG